MKKTSTLVIGWCLGLVMATTTSATASAELSANPLEEGACEADVIIQAPPQPSGCQPDFFAMDCEALSDGDCDTNDCCQFQCSAYWDCSDCGPCPFYYRFEIGCTETGEVRVVEDDGLRMKTGGDPNNHVEEFDAPASCGQDLNVEYSVGSQAKQVTLSCSGC